jgi:intracellular sulfur oxidation DsrE/DsrF family protein
MFTVRPRLVGAQTSAVPPPFTPAFHAEDAWMSAMPGRHRIVLDVTSPEGMPDLVRFVGNLYSQHRSAYGIEEAELAIVACIRHGAVQFGYGNAIWSKYGKTIDANRATPPTGNPYDSGTRMQLSDLAKRGVQFMVCGTASRGLAGRLAGQGGDAETVMKEMAGNLIANARIVPAGVISVTHAQERGFALLYVG